jgi:hypothetical protein
MKKTLLTLALVATAAAAFAQGKVGFVNDANRVFQFGSVLPTDAALAGQSIPANGTGLSDGLSALLYAGTSAGSLTLQTSIPLEGSNLPQAGRMATKQVLLNGVPGAAVQQFQIVVVSTAANRPTTIAGGAGVGEFAGALYFGTSGLFTFTPGTSVTYPVIYAGNTTWAAQPLIVNAVPEPSSMALAGLGAASLLIFRRRK